MTAMMAMMIGVVVAAVVSALLSQAVLPSAYASNPEPGIMVFKFGSMGTGDGEFRRINGIDVGPNGNIFVVDSDNDRIQVFHPNGAFAFKFWDSGYRTNAIAVGPNGNIFLGTSNGVHVFHPNGTFAFKFGPPQEYDGNVFDVAVGPNGNIVTSGGTGDALALAFHPNGTLAFKLGQHDGTRSVAVAPDGTIAVAYLSGAIGLFHSNGTVISSPRLLDSKYARHVDFGPGGEVVVGHGRYSNHGVTLFYPNLTSVVHFNHRIGLPRDVAVGPTGMIAVVPPVGVYGRLHEIRVYSGLESSNELRPSSLIPPTLGGGGANGRSPAYVPPVLYPSLTGSMFAFEFGSRGSGAGEFMGPHNIAVGPGGVIAVSDMGNQRVQVFYPNGTFAFEFGSYGSGAGEFMGPYDLAFGPFGLLVVSDHGNNRVQAFRIQ